jgi:hypothetical protein
MPGYRWLILLIVALAALSVACGDDDGGGESPDATETPAATTAAPTPEPTPTLAPTVTAEPTPVNALTDEIIAAAGAYLSTSSDPAYDLTEPAECSAITEQIDAGEAALEDFVGETLVCLIDPEFADGVVRVGFGAYASEVIGILVLEETEGGGWIGTSIEPGPQLEG